MWVKREDRLLCVKIPDYDRSPVALVVHGTKLAGSYEIARLGHGEGRDLHIVTPQEGLLMRIVEIPDDHG